MKMDADEKEWLDSVERGEWKSAKGGKRERARYSRYAKATFRKDRRLNIRLSSKDLEAIQKRALAEGVPTKIAKKISVLLEDQHVSALTGKQQTRNHLCWTAADDATGCLVDPHAYLLLRRNDWSNNIRDVPIGLVQNGRGDLADADSRRPW